MRLIKILSVILPAAALALFCASCGPADPPDDTTSDSGSTAAEDTGGPVDEKIMYRVTFATSGGNYIAPRNVEEGKKITRIDPRRDGYEFEGWYTVSGEKYDFSSPVTSDVFLVAYWRRAGGFYPSDTASPVYTSASAALNVVWRDRGDESGKRPDSVRCVFTAGTATYYVKITANDAVWDGEAPKEGTLTRGEGRWTAKITGLRAVVQYISVIVIILVQADPGVLHQIFQDLQISPAGSKKQSLPADEGRLPDEDFLYGIQVSRFNCTKQIRIVHFRSPRFHPVLLAKL